MEKDQFSIREANTLFILLAFLFLTVGAYVQSRELISGFLITEFGLMAMPVMFYSAVRKKDIRKIFRLNRMPFSAVVKIMVMAALMVPAVAASNLITLFIIDFFGTPINMPIPTASTMGEFLLLFAVIAGSAGICEELFFRGAILNGYENEIGKKWGAIFSGLLFGIFHFNPQNLFGPIILGIFFAYLVQLTNSIFAAVIAHVTNNGIGVSLGYVGNLFTSEMPSEVATEGLIFESPGVILGVLAFYVVLAFFAFKGFKGIMARLRAQFGQSEVWTHEPLSLHWTHYLPIGLSVMIYGLIIAVAYF